ncbi:hypothetical protein, partial [Actinoallomurus liliacearum]|uniref:hypothetical protein n=1 Tax=Actinoallomurus liliacearum TaxID=1080073 RepID=UPI0031E9BF64
KARHKIDLSRTPRSTGQALGLIRLSGYGALRLARGDRLAAFRMCNAAVLLDVLVGQVFKFTINQFAALSGLAVDLLIAWIIATELRGLRAPRPSGTDLGVPARG